MVKSEQFLKIGLVLDGGLDKPDGVQQYILAIGEYFRSLGHNVTYIVAGPVPDNILGAVSLGRSLNVVSNGNRLSIPFPVSNKKIIKFINKYNLDVLHVQTPYSPFMGERLIIMSPKSTAIIGTFHIVPINLILTIGDWLLGKWCYFSLKRFDQMLSVSSAAKYIAKRDFGIDSNIVPNVVDYSKYATAKPYKSYLDNKINILFLGRLVPRKGCQTLLKSIVKLVKDKTLKNNFRVIICGSGPLELKLKNFVIKNKLREYVEFKGFVNEIEKPRYYASSHIAVFPSYGGESFGIVLIEAMSSKNTMVLAGDNIGYRSVMQVKPELLFEPKNDQVLYEKIKKYINDETARKELTEWGYNYAKIFDVKLVGNKLINIYQDTLLNKNK